MTQKQRYQGIFSTLAIVTLMALYFLAENLASKLEFNGIVQHVEYSIKGSPTVIIKGVEYKLVSNNWAFDAQIEPGDSLIKFKNTKVIKLVKSKTHKVILFY